MTMQKAKRSSKQQHKEISQTKKLREKIRELRQKLSEKNAEMKRQKKLGHAQALEAATHNVLSFLKKKAVAKIKALEKAEASFEKAFAKKMRKHLPFVEKGKSTNEGEVKKTTRTKKRGRPRSK